MALTTYCQIAPKRILFAIPKGEGCGPDCLGSELGPTTATDCVALD